MNFIKTSDRKEKLEICVKLLEKHYSLFKNELYINSIPFIVSNDLYQAFFIDDGTRDVSKSLCYGIMRPYETPLIEKHIIGIEAIFYEIENPKICLFSLLCIADLAEKMKFFGVHLCEKSFHSKIAFETILKFKSIREYPLKYNDIPLQGALEGIYTTFVNPPKSSAFISKGIIINTYKVEITFDGVTTKRTELYRGEGKLNNYPNWQVKEYKSLAKYFFTNGFNTSKDGNFKGGLLEQILQQGYVNQPTISLTGSQNVAAYYATNGHKRDKAVVFAIDIKELSKLGDTFDSYKTMIKYCDWLLPSSLDIIVKIVKSLDVQAAGKFLDKLDRETKNRVDLFGGGSFGNSINWDEFLGSKDINSLNKNGISKNSLEQIQDEFETFWLIVISGGLFSSDIHMDNKGNGDPIEEKIIKSTYHKAFELVKEELKTAFQNNTKYSNLGWDLSPFGYITKTIRDKEYFSPTSIPGNCIKWAAIVDANGVILEKIENND